MKKTIIFIALLFFLTVLLLLLFFSNKKNSNQAKVLPTPTSLTVPLSQKNQSKNLQPGIATIQDVKKVYGNPTKIETKKDFTINYYTLPNTWRQDKIYIKDNIVLYTSKEQLSDNTLYKDFIIQNNKQPDGLLFDLREAGGEAKWYIFSKDGIAFFADPLPSGYTFQTITFPPMSYQVFLKNVAPEFSLYQTQSEAVSVDANNPQVK